MKTTVKKLSDTKVQLTISGSEDINYGNLCFVDKKFDNPISISDAETGISYEYFFPMRYRRKN